MRNACPALTTRCLLLPTDCQPRSGGGGQSGGGQASGGGTMQWTQESAPTEGVQLWIGPETVRQVEQSLSKKGYDVGKVDGQWDRQAEQAAQKFQKEQGMEATGTLTPSLFAGVGMKGWLKGQSGQQQTSGQSGQSGSSKSGQSSQSGSSQSGQSDQKQ